MRRHDFRWLAVFLIASYAVSTIGGLVTYPEIRGWYAGLAKPGFTPPNGVFGPVWTALFLMMGIAAWLAWRAGARRGLWLWSLQLALNLAWSLLFFRYHALFAAAVEVLLLEAAILATMAAFWRRSRAAAALLAPYALWVAFAALLTWSIWSLNA